jgi:hypothetical protein
LVAFVAAACGGTAATSAPTAAPTVAVTVPPVTAAPTEAATQAPAETGGTAADPAEDLQIGGDFTFRPLDENIAQFFVAAMEQSLGSMADVLEVGVREAVKDGQSAGFVIVMRFPGLPVTGDALLDGAAQGAAQGSGTVEDRTIGGQSVKIVGAEGQAAALTMLGDDLVMAVGVSEKLSVDIMTALIEAN